MSRSTHVRPLRTANAVVMKRGAKLLCLAALVGGLGTMQAAHAASARPARSSFSGGILSQLNAVRRAHGLTMLRPSGSLAAAARSHSVEMVADGYFAHPSKDGSAFWLRVQSYY